MTEFSHMRRLAMAFTALAIALPSSAGAVSGQVPITRLPDPTLVQGTSNFSLSKRESQLKAAIGIKAEQEPAWVEYLLARRQHEKIVRFSQRQELKEFAVGAGSSFEPTLSNDEPEDFVASSKLALKESFDRLYAVLDEVQKARADETLTPSECGQ
jgi:hypothetical protein